MNQLTRKKFLGGVLMASASLPVVAALPARVGVPTGEKIKPKEIAIVAGAKKPFSVLHVSDTHLTAVYPHEDKWKQEMARADTPIFGAKQEEALAESIAYAKRHCDFLLHTGDLIDFVSAANLDVVKRHLPAGCIGALGNHEYSHYGWLVKKAGTAGPGREETRKMLSAYYPFRLPLAAKEVNGVVFVALDDADGTVTADQVAEFRLLAAQGKPIILCLHVPFYTSGICRAGKRWWQKGTNEANPELKLPDFQRQKSDPHLHMFTEDRFSPTAIQYVAAGNFSFKAHKVKVS